MAAQDRNWRWIMILIFGLWAVWVIVNIPGWMMRKKCEGFGKGCIGASMGAINTALAMYYEERDSAFPRSFTLVPISEIGLGSYITTPPVTPWKGQFFYRGDSQSYELWAAVNEGRGCDDEPGTPDDFMFYSSRLGRIQETSVWAP